MKNAYIHVTLFCCLLLSAVPIKAETLYWIGHTPDAALAENWSLTSGGNSANTSPGANDVLIFDKRASGHKVVFSRSLTIKGLFVQDNIPIALEVTEGAELTIQKGIGLSPETTLSGSGTINVLGAAEQSVWVQLSSDQKRKVTMEPTGNFLDTAHSEASTEGAGNRGSCAFFTIQSEVTPPTCNGNNNGSITILPVTDGVGPFTYQWVFGPAGNVWNNLGAGTYTIIVMDLGQGGISCSQDVFVNEPGPLTVFAMQPVAPLCSYSCDGQASPIIIGGNGGYTLNWSSGETGPIASELCETFTLQITDSKGCQLDTTYTYLNMPLPVSFNPDVQHIYCFGAADGAIDLEPTGGTGAIIISWTGPDGFTANTTDIAGLLAGDYTATAQDAEGCSYTEVITVTEFPELQLSHIKQNNICPNGDDGAIDLSVTGGSGVYSYSWSGPDGFMSSNEDLTGLATGLYDITVTDDNGCSKTEQIDLSEPFDIVISSTQTDVLCFEAFTGAASVSATGGTAPYQFAWAGPGGYTNTGTAANNIQAGQYIITLTDANLCTQKDTVLITQPDSIHVVNDQATLICNNAGDAAFDITISGGVAPYGVAWSGPDGFSSSSEDISNLEAGIYVLTVTDANNCTKSYSYEVQNPVALALSAVISPTTCSSGATGAIDLTVDQGTAPYTYAWTGPGSFSSTQEDLSALAAGTYHVLVEDANGCSAEESFQVVSPNSMSFAYTSVNNTCFGGTAGSIDITVTGGQGPYIYLWAGPPPFWSVQEDITNLAAGDYSLLVRDANMCTAVFDLIITEPDEILITETITTPSCAGVADGSVALTTTGGVPPYSYSWTSSNGFSSNSKDINGLSGGTYTVTVTDANNCQVSEDYLLQEPEVLDVTAALTYVICAMDSDGMIEIDISGGTSPYTTTWAGPNGFSSTTEDISGLSEGLYNLDVVDANGCFFENSYLIEPKVVITADALVNQITCAGNTNGSVFITLSGGNEPYTINWNGPGGFTSSSLFITNLSAGTYTLNVSETNGCSASFSYEIIQPQPLDLSFSSSPIQCAGVNDASISAIVSGGALPYTYSWSGPDGFTAATATISDLASGEYIVLVEDANGCTVTDTAVVNAVSPIALNLEITEPECLVNNGQLLVNPSGGTVVGNYQIEWFHQGNLISTNDTINNLGGGTFSVTVTDDNGCTADTTFQLERNTFDVNAMVQNITCAGADNGSVDITVSGGTAPFTYSWVGPNGFTAASADITDLIAGTYTLTITDGTGCEVVLEYDIDNPVPLSFNATVVQELCIPNSGASIHLNPAGGSLPYTVTWSGPDGFSSNALSASNLAAGIYNITLSDFFGCTADTIIELIAPAAPEVHFATTDLLCFGANTGTVSTTISGGVSPYSFLWSGPNGFSANTDAVLGLSAGVYWLTVEGANGCQTTDSVVVNEPAEIVANIIPSNSTCLNSDGSADVDVTGGFGPYTYSWLDETGTVLSTLDSLENVPAGIYSLIITDSAAVCTVETDFSISDASGDVDGFITDLLCHNDSSGAIDISVTGGVAPLTYAWSGPDGFISTIEDLTNIPQGEYSVEVTDVNGCQFTELFTVGNADSLAVSAAITNVNCFGNNGAIDITPIGGTAPYSYSWTGPNGFSAATEDVVALDTGYYQVNVTDINLCTTLTEFFVDTIPQLQISPSITDVSCDDIASGAIEIEIAGGTPGYTFAWSGPASFSSTQQDITAITAGEYILQVTDNGGCTALDTFIVANAASISVAVTVVNSSCTTDDGSVSIVINNGADPADFIIQWFDEDNFYISNNDTVNGLGVGIYELYVTDSTGCTYYQPVYMSAGDADITADVTNATCEANGAIDLHISGAVEPYTVIWTDPIGFTYNTEDLTGIGAGDYLVQIEDAAGCTYIQSYSIDAPEALEVELSQLLVPCPEMQNGVIDIAVTGGVGPYTISWLGPDGFTANGTSVNGLQPGVYTLSVTDQNLCSVADTFNLGVGTEINPEFYITSIDCYGDSTGTIESVITGGNPPYQIEWTGDNGFSASGPDLLNLPAGDYTVEITDANNCVYNGEIEIFQSPQITYTIVTGSEACAGQDSVLTVQINPVGGTGSLNILWTGPNGFSADSTYLDSLIAGEYILQINDSIGCSLSDTILLSVPDSIQVVAQIDSISCFEANDGAISIEVSGGMPPYTYQWTIPDLFDSEEQDIFNLFPGTYLLLITDANDCTAEFTYILPGPEPVEVSVDFITDTQCATDTSGTVEISVTGGTGDYTFQWSGPDGFSAMTQNISGLLPGVYGVVVTDENGCISDTAATVNYTFDFTASAGSDTAFCANESPVVLHGFSEHAFEYFWLTMDGDTLSYTDSLVVDTTLGEGQYIFAASNGLCAASDTVFVQIFDVPVVNAGSDQEVFYEDVVELGGDPTSGSQVVYNWQPTLNGEIDSTLANPVATLRETTEFIVYVTSNDGCINSDTVQIIVIPNVIISSGFTPNGDGVNDLWIIDNMMLFPNNSVQVFSRWGDAVYEAKPYRDGSGWDGTYEGKPLPAGTYYYTIELNDPRFPKPFTGPITIFR